MKRQSPAELKNELELEERTLAAVTAQYNGACESLAAGEAADPEKYRTVMIRRSCKVRGLRELLRDVEREQKTDIEE